MVTDALDLTVAVYWTLDILGTFFTGFYSRKGELIRTHKEIALHYLTPGCQIACACRRVPVQVLQVTCSRGLQRKRWFFLDVMIVSVDWIFMSASLGLMPAT